MRLRQTIALATVFGSSVAVLSGVLAIAWQNPPAAPAPSGATPAAGRGAPAPAQFPPMGNDLTPEDTASLQAAVDRLTARVSALKRQYRDGPMADRVADVEVYLDAVRRPLKYGERLYAGRGSTAAAYAVQTLNT